MMNLPNFENNAEKQIKWLKTQLSITQAETQVIKSEKENLEEELQEVEYQVRLEAAEEIQAQLQVMRDEYNAMYYLLRYNLDYFYILLKVTQGHGVGYPRRY
jgi:uncharacterized protein (DUF3084 family)